MNLFNKLAGHFKAQNREAKAKEGIVPTVVVAKPEGPKPYIVQHKVKVPVGYVLPLGEVVKEQFWLTIEAGVRWHPEWEQPRVTVNAWRVFRMGDALGWSGDSVLSFKSLLPAEVIGLVEFHGQKISDLGDYGREAVEKAGLEVPKVQQPLSTFNTFRNA